jgi:hypothetical protein
LCASLRRLCYNAKPIRSGIFGEKKRTIKTVGPPAECSPAFGNPARSRCCRLNNSKPLSALRPSLTRGVPLSLQVVLQITASRILYADSSNLTITTYACQHVLSALRSHWSKSQTAMAGSCRKKPAQKSSITASEIGKVLRCRCFAIKPIIRSPNLDIMSFPRYAV